MRGGITLFPIENKKNQVLLTLVLTVIRAGIPTNYKIFAFVQNY